MHKATDPGSGKKRHWNIFIKLESSKYCLTDFFFHLNHENFLTTFNILKGFCIYLFFLTLPWFVLFDVSECFACVPVCVPHVWLVPVED